MQFSVSFLDLRDQFAMYSHGQIDKMKKDYDIKSLMHYSSTAFGVNGKTTIVSLHPGKTVGEATTYSELDIIEINALYDCKTSSARTYYLYKCYRRLLVIDI